MIIIKIKEKGGIDKALKDYKSKSIKIRIMKELNNRKQYKKKSVERREEIKKAIYVRKKYS